MNVPPVPSSLSDMYRLLSKPEWVRWTLAGQTRDEKFFTRQTVSADGLTSLHFFSPYLPPYVITVPQCDYYIGFLKVSNPSKKPIVVISVFVELGGRQRVKYCHYCFSNSRRIRCCNFQFLYFIFFSGYTFELHIHGRLH